MSSGQPSGRKIQTGDPFEGINARDWNSFLDAAEWVKSETGPGSKRSTRQATFKKRPGVVKVKNVSGVALPQFSIVGVRSEIFDPAVNIGEFKREPSFKVEAPNCIEHPGKFGVLLDPLSAGIPGNVGEAVFSGVVQARVLICNAGHEFCDVKDNDTTALISTNRLGGAQILARQPGLGSVWALIRISNKVDDSGCVVTCTTTSRTTTTTTTAPATTTTTSHTTTTGTTTTSTTQTTTSVTTTTTSFTTTTSQTTCPAFTCTPRCFCSFEVVTDIRCDRLDGGFVVTKIAICLPSVQIDTQNQSIKFIGFCSTTFAGTTAPWVGMRACEQFDRF